MFSITPSNVAHDVKNLEKMFNDYEFLQLWVHQEKVKV